MRQSSLYSSTKLESTTMHYSYIQSHQGRISTASLKNNWALQYGPCLVRIFIIQFPLKWFKVITSISFVFTRAYREHSFSLLSMNMASAKLLLCSKSLLFGKKHPQILHSVFLSSDLRIFCSRHLFWFKEPGTAAQQLHSYRRVFLFMDLNVAVFRSASFPIYTPIRSIWRCFFVSHHFLTCHSSHSVCKEDYYFL